MVSNKLGVQHAVNWNFLNTLNHQFYSLPLATFNMKSPDSPAKQHSLSTIDSHMYHIAGITTVVYGLNNIPKTCKFVSCLWLLHPRLQTKEAMFNVATSCISQWNLQPSSKELGLIAVSFDQRNHGTREVSELTNLSWRKGNERHAIDLFSILHGTAVDTSLLIDYLGSYILYEPDSPVINDHLVLGVSLGGHSAWQVLFSDERVSTGVIIIGCPDYTQLMSNRAQHSDLESAGAKFLGSKDFPRSLIDTIKKRDPKAILFGTGEITTNPSEVQQGEYRSILETRLKNKQILVCSGSNDKLVPYLCTEPFLRFLKTASREYTEIKLCLENKVYHNVGHTFTDEMLHDSIQFVTDSLNRAVKKNSPRI